MQNNLLFRGLLINLSLLAASCGGTSGVPSALPTDYVAYYPLDTNFNDTTDHHYGSGSGSVSFVDDIERGQVAIFNGKNAHITIGKVKTLLIEPLGYDGGQLNGIAVSPDHYYFLDHPSSSIWIGDNPLTTISRHDLVTPEDCGGPCDNDSLSYWNNSIYLDVGKNNIDYHLRYDVTDFNRWLVKVDAVDGVNGTEEGGIAIDSKNKRAYIVNYNDYNDRFFEHDLTTFEKNREISFKGDYPLIANKQGASYRGNYMYVSSAALGERIYKVALPGANEIEGTATLFLELEDWIEIDHVEDIDYSQTSDELIVADTFQKLNYFKRPGDTPNDTIYPSNKITISFWVNIEAVESSESWTLISNGGYEIGYNDSGDAESYYFSVNGIRAEDVNVNDWQPGVWHFVTGVYDGKSIRLYLNGSQVASVVASGDVVYGKKDNTYLGVSAEKTNYFSGFIDDVKIFSRKLSPEEIQNLYCCAPSY